MGELGAKDPHGNKLPFLAVRRKPSGAAKPEGLRPTASFNPVIYFRAAPKSRELRAGRADRDRVRGSSPILEAPGNIDNRWSCATWCVL